MKYRSEIDGLRALAVVPVMFFHAGFEAFSGGFVGVDIFFVISGFLITSIILAEREAGTFSLQNFYERRVRRILPALFLVLSLCIPVAWVLLLPDDMKEFSNSLAAVPLFSSNFLFAHEAGYFGPREQLKPLLHTWSLAVEEQYYILFPLLLILTWRFGWTIPLLLAVGILSFGIAESGALRRASAFFLLPTRCWELVLGALIAFYVRQPRQIRIPGPIRELLAVLGIVLIAYSIHTYSEQTPFPGIYALVPTLGTALILLFATQATYAGRALGTGFFVGIGLISYSTYLFHQPLFAFARHLHLAEPSALTFFLLCFASLALGFVSWRFVEMPFRRKNGFNRRSVMIFATVGSTAFIIIGLGGSLSNGFEFRLDARQRNLLESYRASGENIESTQECHLHSNSLNAAIELRFTNCATKYGKAVVVIGDSHGANLYRAISANSGYPFIFGLSREHCRPHAARLNCYYDDFLEFLKVRSQNIKFVVYNQAGFYLVEDTAGNSGTRAFFRKPAIPVYKPHQGNIDLVAAYLNQISEHADVVWAGPWIEPHQNVSQLRKYALRCKSSDIQINPNIPATFSLLEAAIKARLEPASKVTYFSIIDAVVFDPAKDLYDCNAVYWRDGDHWSQMGERAFGERILKKLSF